MKQNSWAAHAGCALEEGGSHLRSEAGSRPSSGRAQVPRDLARRGDRPCSLPSGLEGRRNEEGPQQLCPGGANHAMTGNGGHKGPWAGAGGMWWGVGVPLCYIESYRPGEVDSAA